MSLAESVRTLSMIVATLRDDLDTNISSIKDGSVFADRNFSSVLSGINFFETCETVIENNCTIHQESSGTSPLPCITSEVPLYKVSGITCYNIELI
jgi:hypothetical protein